MAVDPAGKTDRDAVGPDVQVERPDTDAVAVDAALDDDLQARRRGQRQAQTGALAAADAPRHDRDPPDRRALRARREMPERGEVRHDEHGGPRWAGRDVRLAR